MDAGISAISLSEGSRRSDVREQWCFCQERISGLGRFILHGWLALIPSDQAARWLSVLLGTVAVL